jgi:hypothetical protein
MKGLGIAVALVALAAILSPQSAQADAPTGISADLWQAYQDVAIAPAASFPYQVIGNTYVDQTPRNDKWFAAPNVIVTGAPNSDDLRALKDFTSTVAQSCTGMAPSYQTQIQTVSTVVRRGFVSTVTTTTPNTYLMDFYYVPTAGFVKVSSALNSISSTATDAAIFNYDSAGHIYGTKSLLSTSQATQDQRNMAMKRYFLQALGLFGTTTNKSASAFLTGNTSWDGTLSDFDRELIALHCSAAVPSYKSAPEISDSLSQALSHRTSSLPKDTYNVAGSATETSASFVVSAPSIDNQIVQGVDHLNYSVSDDSGRVIDKGKLLIGSELFKGSWTLSYANLTPYSNYTLTVAAENNAGVGPTTSYGLFTWNYGNL